MLPETSTVTPTASTAPSAADVTTVTEVGVEEMTVDGTAVTVVSSADGTSLDASAVSFVPILEGEGQEGAVMEEIVTEGEQQ